jgi:hypothetical protein
LRVVCVRWLSAKSQKMTQGAKLRRRATPDVLKRQKRHAEAAKQMRVGKLRIKAKKADQKLLNYQVRCHQNLGARVDG